MKKCFIIAIAMLTNLITNAQRPPFDDYIGDGTEYNPYRIYTKEHLMELGDSIKNYPVYPANNWTKGKYFILMTDITDSLDTPIGIATDNVTFKHYPFQGNFDGNNNKITLAIYDKGISSSIFYGLFSMISKAKIINLTVDGYIKNNLNTLYSLGVGAIVGLARDSCEIYNCTSYVDITVERSCLGGIIGRADYPSIIVANCINYGNIESTGGYTNYGNCGGIVGFVGGNGLNWLIEIINCSNYGKITGNTYIGGIVGFNSNCPLLITNSINCGFIKGINGYWVSNYVGGIFGGNDATISNCINTGKVTGADHIGGITGFYYTYTSNVPTISNCLNIADVEGSNNIGGILGYGKYFTKGSILINNSTNSGFVKGKDNVGGIVGYTNNIDSITIENCVNTGVIEGNSNTNGIIGDD